MVNAWKAGSGIGAIILGVYILFNFASNIPSAIFGIIAIAFGFGLLVSELK